MSSIKFPYTREWNGDEIDYWAKIPVTLVGKNKRVLTVSGIVDTGAQHCIAKMDYARVLGIDLYACEPYPVGGLGGSGRPGYRTNIELRIVDFNYYAIQVPVIFTEFDEDMLLGQKGFFDYFNLNLQKARGIFTLTQNKLK